MGQNYPNFLPGNDHAVKMVKDEWLSLFHQMYEWVADEANEALSLSDVRVEFKIARSTYYQKCKQYSELSEYRDLMQDLIIAKVNKQGLKSEFNPTMSIFRLKQLGEIDVSTVNQNHSGGFITSHKVIFEDYTDED